MFVIFSSLESVEPFVRFGLLGSVELFESWFISGSLGFVETWWFVEIRQNSYGEDGTCLLVVYYLSILDTRQGEDLLSLSLHLTSKVYKKNISSLDGYKYSKLK